VLSSDQASSTAVFAPAPQRKHLLTQFLDLGLVSGHIRSSRLNAGAGLSGRGLVFAPAPPPNRETVGLQGRAERAEARDEPLQRDGR
jgi:hypothetical protein